MVLAPLVTDRIAPRAVDEAAVANLVDHGNLFRDLDGVRWQQMLQHVPISFSPRPPSIYRGRAFRDVGREFFAGCPQVRKVDGRCNLDPAGTAGDRRGH